MAFEALQCTEGTSRDMVLLDKVSEISVGNCLTGLGLIEHQETGNARAFRKESLQAQSANYSCTDKQNGQIG
ncbi:MAG TPA: hypothetical protein DCL54_11505 [Alphaproteobacteria bacterium]|nr:hypothetical protein [Alphaproteobacteria bacterium]